MLPSWKPPMQCCSRVLGWRMLLNGLSWAYFWQPLEPAVQLCSILCGRC